MKGPVFRPDEAVQLCLFDYRVGGLECMLAVVGFEGDLRLRYEQRALAIGVEELIVIVVYAEDGRAAALDGGAHRGFGGGYVLISIKLGDAEKLVSGGLRRVQPDRFLQSQYRVIR